MIVIDSQEWGNPRRSSIRAFDEDWSVSFGALYLRSQHSSIPGYSCLDWQLPFDASLTPQSAQEAECDDQQQKKKGIVIAEDEQQCIRPQDLQGSQRHSESGAGTMTVNHEDKDCRVVGGMQGALNAETPNWEVPQPGHNIHRT